MESIEKIIFNKSLNKLEPAVAQQLYYNSIGKLLQFMVQQILEQNSCITEIEYEGSNHWAMLTYFDSISNIKLSLRYSENGYDLLLTYYNVEKEDFVQIPGVISLPQLMKIPNLILIQLKNAWIEKKKEQ